MIDIHYIVKIEYETLFEIRKRFRDSEYICELTGDARPFCYGYILRQPKGVPKLWKHP